MINDMKKHIEKMRAISACLRVLALLTPSCCFLSAIADTYVLDSALSGRDDIDWTVASSYSGTYSRNPAANDTVEIPANMTAKVTAGSASWTLINTLSRIVPKDRAVFEVDVPGIYEGKAVLSVPVTEYLIEGAQNSGTLRKTGDGALELASYGKVKDGANVCDYCLNLDVPEGTLHLYQGGTSASEVFRHGVAFVEEGATLDICKTGYTYLSGLNGNGFVTLCNSTEQCMLLYGLDYSIYGGWMNGKIRVEMTQGRHDITCPTNAINTICLSGSAVCGFTRLGRNNSASSSLGTGNFNLSASSGIIYLGTESGASSKTFWIASNTFIDAGAYGGLTLSGKFDSSGNGSYLRTFTLGGSNENVCVISGSFPGKADQKNVFNLVKKGTGTWRMAHATNRGSLGVIDVEDGTLQFDSIAAKGEACSLGYATNLFEKATGIAYASGIPVGYAIVLGGDGTEGTLEYTGTAAATCDSRPIAVRSKGRFKTTNASYALNNAYALGEGEKTLTLDSSVATGYGCTATKLSDGSDDGRLSVVKEGDGIWQLTGTNTFTGSAVARGGTLLINNPSGKYKWYRFVVTENAYSCDRYDTAFSVGEDAAGDPKPIDDSESRLIQIMSLALYDEDGNNLVYGFRQKTPITQFAFEGGDARIMEPGEVAIGQTGSLFGFTHERTYLQNLFSTTAYPATGGLESGAGGIKQDDQSTWLPIVVRLPDDAPAAVRIDFQCGRNSNGVESYNGRNLTAFRLDASADGVNWVEGIAQNGTVVVPKWYPKWDSDGSNESVSAVRKDKGTVLSSSGTDKPLSNRYSFSAIGAANGGVVRVTGSPYEVSGLVVDAEAAAGAISNVVFSASGTLEVLNANLPDGASVDLPGDYSHLSGVSNIARWSLMLDGEACCTKVVGVRDGKLRISPRGIRIIVR